MKQVAHTKAKGLVKVIDVPEPLLMDNGVLIESIASLLSAGTELAKIDLARKNLFGKARSRPDLVHQVLSTAQSEGINRAARKVINRLTNLEPMGYSCSGCVKAIGENVQSYKVGDLVAGAGAGYANHAEINFIPKNLIAKVPNGINADQAAFTTLGAIALQGVRQSDVGLGETVVVIGLGLLGLLTVQILISAGCNVIGMDLNAKRCRLAEQMGCHSTTATSEYLPTVVSTMTSGFGADAVILTAATKSSEPLSIAGQIARDRAKIVVVGDVGMQIPRPIYFEKELDLRLSRSYGPGRYDPEYEEKGHDYPIGYIRWTEQRNMVAFLELLAQGKVDVEGLISHRYPIERAAEAYETLSDPGENTMGVLLTYKGDRSPSPMEPVIESLPRNDEEEPHSAIFLDKTSKGVGDGSSELSIGIIGAGNFAQDVILPVLNSIRRLNLRGVSTASGLSARSVQDRFGFDYSASTPDDILSDEDIDVVFILTRHDVHSKYAIQALRNGKHVFVEKPLAINTEQLNNLLEGLEELKERDAILPHIMVGFNRRFAPSVMAVKEHFNEMAEAISVYCRVNAGFLPSDHWLHDIEEGGGRIVGEGCHFVDLLCFIIGSKPTELFASSLPDAGRYRRDNVCAQISFEDGSVGTLHYMANGDKRAGKEYIEVIGGGSVAQIDDFRKWTIYDNGRKKTYRGRLFQQDKGHRREIELFIDAIMSDSHSPIPIHELIASTQLTFKVNESLLSGVPVTF